MALTDGLIAAWNFEDADADSGGAAYNLTAAGAPGFVSGKLNNCVDFDSDEYLALASPGDLDRDGHVSFTIAGWVYWPTATPAGTHAIASCAEIDGGNGWALLANNAGGIRALIRVGNTEVSNNVGADGLFSPDTWYHVAFDHDADNDEVHVYVNGSQVAMTTMSEGMQASGVPFYFNNYHYSGAVEDEVDYPCRLDAWAAWNRVLSGAEILQLYNGGVGLEYPFVPTRIPGRMLLMGVG